MHIFFFFALRFCEVRQYGQIHYYLCYLHYTPCRFSTRTSWCSILYTFQITYYWSNNVYSFYLMIFHLNKQNIWYSGPRKEKKVLNYKTFLHILSQFVCSLFTMKFIVNLMRMWTQTCIEFQIISQINCYFLSLHESAIQENLKAAMLFQSTWTKILWAKLRIRCLIQSSQFCYYKACALERKFLIN